MPQPYRPRRSYTHRRNTLTRRIRIARRCRRGGPTNAVTLSTVLLAIVSSTMPPTLTNHEVATATAGHRRAARGMYHAGTLPLPAPRLVSLQPCSIQARKPYQAAMLASGGKSVTSSQAGSQPASKGPANELVLNAVPVPCQRTDGPRSARTMPVMVAGMVTCRCWSKRNHSAFQAPRAVAGKNFQATGRAQPR